MAFTMQIMFGITGDQQYVRIGTGASGSFTASVTIGIIGDEISNSVNPASPMTQAQFQGWINQLESDGHTVRQTS